MAEQTIARGRDHLRCSDIEVLTGDVTEYGLPDDVTVIFMADPFRAADLRCGDREDHRFGRSQSSADPADLQQPGRGRTARAHGPDTARPARPPEGPPLDHGARPRDVRDRAQPPMPSGSSEPPARPLPRRLRRPAARTAAGAAAGSAAGAGHAPGPLRRLGHEGGPRRRGRRARVPARGLRARPLRPAPGLPRRSAPRAAQGLRRGGRQGERAPVPPAQRRRAVPARARDHRLQADRPLRGRSRPDAARARACRGLARRHLRARHGVDDHRPERRAVRGRRARASRPPLPGAAAPGRDQPGRRAAGPGRAVPPGARHGGRGRHRANRLQRPLHALQVRRRFEARRERRTPASSG